MSVPTAIMHVFPVFHSPRRSAKGARRARPAMVIVCLEAIMGESPAARKAGKTDCCREADY